MLATIENGTKAEIKVEDSALIGLARVSAAETSRVDTADPEWYRINDTLDLTIIRMSILG